MGDFPRPDRDLLLDLLGAGDLDLGAETGLFFLPGDFDFLPDFRGVFVLFGESAALFFASAGAVTSTVGTEGEVVFSCFCSTGSWGLAFST